MKLSQRLAINLAGSAALAGMFALMVACSGAGTPPQPPPAPPRPAATQASQEPERIPAGSPVVIRGKGRDVWAVDNALTYSRLAKFVEANDAKGQADLIKARRVAELPKGTYGKVISYIDDHLIEVRIQSGAEKGNLWIVEAVNVVDNRTTSD